MSFQTLKDPIRMQGDYGSILGGASLNLDTNVEEIIISGDPKSIYRQSGSNVSLNISVKDNIIYPLDLESMEMLGLYHAYEKTVDFWSQQLGLDFEEFPSLYYNPRASSESDGTNVSVTINLNAAYLSGAKDFWFFQTSPLELIPVKMNYGVVAHEFGHYIFDRFFANFNPLVYETDIYSNSYKLSAINEGLADFLSYLTTESVNEFGASLKNLADERTLPVAWNLSDLRRPICTGSFYCEGSVLASALFEAMQDTQLDRVAMTEIILGSLDEFSVTWEENRNTQEFNYHYIINAILNQLNNDSNQQKFCTRFFRKIRSY